MKKIIVSLATLFVAATVMTATQAGTVTINSPVEYRFPATITTFGGDRYSWTFDTSSIAGQPVVHWDFVLGRNPNQAIQSFSYIAELLGGVGELGTNLFEEVVIVPGGGTNIPTGNLLLEPWQGSFTFANTFHLRVDTGQVFNGEATLRAYVVPEPSSALFGGFAALGLLVRRRR